MSTLADTLVTDTASLSVWTAQPEYNYTSDFVRREFSFWQWVGEQLENIVQAIFGNEFYEEYGGALWFIVGFVLFLVLLMLIVWRYPQLIGLRPRKLSAEQEQTEDTIYGIDFPVAIAAAVAAANHYEAVRLTYLATLRRLSDDGHIQWRPSKTPSQYAREYVSPQFLRLSTIFLRVRYGGFPADRRLYEESRGLSEAVLAALDEKKGGQP